MLPALIGAGASILGGALSSSATRKANAENLKYQREFAQQGIQWRVADAKAAGIHPVYALGAQTTAFSPSFVGDTGLGQGIADAGQNIARSMEAAASQGERVTNNQIQRLTIQRMGLENELLASKIATTQQPGNPPAFPMPGNEYLIDGQGPALKASGGIGPGRGLVVEGPLERVASAPGRPHQEPGAINETGFARTSTGWAPVQSGDIKQRIEEDMIGTAGWNLRNRLAPTLGNVDPPPFSPGKNRIWIWDPSRMEYQTAPATGTPDSSYDYMR